MSSIIQNKKDKQNEQHKKYKQNSKKCKWCNEEGILCHGEQYGTFLNKYMNKTISLNEQHTQELLDMKFLEYYQLLNEFDNYKREEKDDLQNSCINKIPLCLERYKKTYMFG